MRRTLAVILVCLVILAAMAAGILYFMIMSYESTEAGGSGSPVPVMIPRGAGPQQIAGILEEHGVVEDAQAFYRYLRYYRRAAGEVKAGELAFRDDMTPEEVLQVLLDGTPVTHRITVPEGLRIDEVARLFEKAGLANAQVFEETARDPALARSLGLPANSLEGFLHPETYHFRKPTPVEDILRSMVSSYRQVFTQAWKQRASQMGMTELQVVTLASIVEKETGVAHERSLIAGVFHNRLRKNWRLDTDPTVIYAVLLTSGSFNGNLTKDDLGIDHPYNTYRRKGLPPGPICNPGTEAIRATLYPQQTEHMFFVSKNNGTHHFCPNLACHNRAVKRYQGGD